MPYLVFDTETTGLCDFNRPAHAEGQPRLASWAMMFVDDDLQVTEGHHGMVKPDGWTMPSEASAINGLTDERLHAEGRSIRLPLFLIGLAIEQQYTLVAHNLQYDAKVMRGELRRLGWPEAEYCKAEFGICTMKRLTNACAIPSKLGRYKWPRLEEACRIILGKEPSGAHTAQGDAMDCLELLRAMRERGMPIEPTLKAA